jgi:hypothetical protein
MGMADAVREDARERVLGVAAALVVVAPFGAMLLSQPGAGTVALLGAGVVGAVGVFLSIQQREAVGVGTKQRHRDLGQHRFQEGSHGGLFGAWVDAADGEERARRRRVAVSATSFLWALCLGSFGTLVVVSVLVAP